MVITRSWSGELNNVPDPPGGNANGEFHRLARIMLGARELEPPSDFEDLEIDDYHTLSRCPLFHRRVGSY